MSLPEPTTPLPAVVLGPGRAPAPGRGPGQRPRQPAAVATVALAVTSLLMSVVGALIIVVVVRLVHEALYSMLDLLADSSGTATGKPSADAGDPPLFEIGLISGLVLFVLQMVCGLVMLLLMRLANGFAAMNAVGQGLLAWLSGLIPIVVIVMATLVAL